VKSIFQTIKSGVTCYTVIYAITSPAVWDLGLTRSLSFSFADSEGAFTTPYVNQVNL